MTNLTREERARFADWCKEESTSYDQIDEQLLKLGKHSMLIVESHRILKLSLQVVAKHLNVETQNV